MVGPRTKILERGKLTPFSAHGGGGNSQYARKSDQHFWRTPWARNHIRSILSVAPRPYPKGSRRTPAVSPPWRDSTARQDRELLKKRRETTITIYRQVPYCSVCDICSVCFIFSICTDVICGIWMETVGSHQISHQTALIRYHPDTARIRYHPRRLASDTTPDGSQQILPRTTPRTRLPHAKCLSTRTKLSCTMRLSLRTKLPRLRGWRGGVVVGRFGVGLARWRAGRVLWCGVGEVARLSVGRPAGFEPK